MFHLLGSACYPAEAPADGPIIPLYHRNVPTVAILPVKSFRLGKGRMAESLSPDNRSILGQRLAERTAEVAVGAGLIPVLVAGDAAVAGWALRQGFPSIPDPDQGLNGAAAAGARWAGLSASHWLVLHTDLPLLMRSELVELADILAGDGWVIAPSADGGTSALGGRGEAGFSYGPGSFHRHLARFREARIVSRTGLLHDVDSFSDLESARMHPRGKWLREIP
jgi:2-phospho-L-lactate guanylyltransferase